VTIKGYQTNVFTCCRVTENIVGGTSNLLHLQEVFKYMCQSRLRTSVWHCFGCPCEIRKTMCEMYSRTA